MKDFPKISIVTVNFNQADYLEACILSVLNQNYPNLEYIIIDGGSDDGSVEIIKKYENQLAYWVSEPDEGQYFAVQKGFERSTGEIMSWLNSDDLYQPNSLFGVAEIFETYSDVKWLTGIAREYNEQGVIINRIMPNWSRWSKYRFLTYDFQFVQQESTFWKRSLWDKAGGKMDTSLVLAGDMELWARFFRFEKLYTTTYGLGGFRYRSDDQRSVLLRAKYLKECYHVIRRERNEYSFAFKFRLTLLKVIAFFSSVFFFYDLPVLRRVYIFFFRIPDMINYNPTNHTLMRNDQMTKHPPLVINGWAINRKKTRKISKND